MRSKRWRWNKPRRKRFRFSPNSFVRRGHHSQLQLKGHQIQILSFWSVVLISMLFMLFRLGLITESTCLWVTHVVGVVGFWWGSGCHGGCLFPAINIPRRHRRFQVDFCSSPWFKRSVQDKMSNTMVQDTSIPSEADRTDDDAALKKRKRKGFGNWTRSALACDRCRKKKIKVLPVQSVLIA